MKVELYIFDTLNINIFSYKLITKYYCVKKKKVFIKKYKITGNINKIKWLKIYEQNYCI